MIARDLHLLAQPPAPVAELAHERHEVPVDGELVGLGQPRWWPLPRQPGELGLGSGDRPEPLQLLGGARVLARLGDPRAGLGVATARQHAAEHDPEREQPDATRGLGPGEDLATGAFGIVQAALLQVDPRLDGAQVVGESHLLLPLGEDHALRDGAPCVVEAVHVGEAPRQVGPGTAGLGVVADGAGELEGLPHHGAPLLAPVVLAPPCRGGAHVDHGVDEHAVVAGLSCQRHRSLPVDDRDVLVVGQHGQLGPRADGHRELGGCRRHGGEDLLGLARARRGPVPVRGGPVHPGGQDEAGAEGTRVVHLSAQDHRAVLGEDRLGAVPEHVQLHRVGLEELGLLGPREPVQVVDQSPEVRERLPVRPGGHRRPRSPRSVRDHAVEVARLDGVVDDAVGVGHGVRQQRVEGATVQGHAAHDRQRRLDRPTSELVSEGHAVGAGLQHAARLGLGDPRDGVVEHPVDDVRGHRAREHRQLVAGLLGRR